MKYRTIVETQAWREQIERVQEAAEGWPTPNKYTEALAALTTRIEELDEALDTAHARGYREGVRNEKARSATQIEKLERDRDQAVAAMAEIQRKYVRTDRA